MGFACPASPPVSITASPPMGSRLPEEKSGGGDHTGDGSPAPHPAGAAGCNGQEGAEPQLPLRRRRQGVTESRWQRNNSPLLTSDRKQQKSPMVRLLCDTANRTRCPQRTGSIFMSPKGWAGSEAGLRSQTRVQSISSRQITPRTLNSVTKCSKPDFAYHQKPLGWFFVSVLFLF